MGQFNLINKLNFLPTKEDGRFKVRSAQYNELVDKLNSFFTADRTLSADVISESTSANGVAVDGVTLKDGGIVLGTGGIQVSGTVVEFTKDVTLTATEIVGSSAGSIGHTDGAILVAAPTSAYALEFVSAVLVDDRDTATYTGGSDDAVIRVGTVVHTVALTDANYIKGTGDKVYVVRPLSDTAELSLPVGSTINLAGTAFTNPGTAAGVLRAKVTYRVITTGL
jgi:hypothetical protein